MSSPTPSDLRTVRSRIEDVSHRIDSQAMVILLTLCVLALALPMTQVEASTASLPGPQHGSLTLFHSFGLVFDLKATDMFTGSDYGTGSGPAEDGGWQFSLALLLVRIGSIAVIPALILALLLGLVGGQQQLAHRRLALGTLYVAIAALMLGHLVSPGVGTGENGDVVLDLGVGPAWWMLVIIIVQVHLTPRTPTPAQESSRSRHERT